MSSDENVLFSYLESLATNETVFIQDLANEVLVKKFKEVATNLRNRVNFYGNIDERRKDVLLQFVCDLYDENVMNLRYVYNVCKYLNDPRNKRGYVNYLGTINNPVRAEDDSSNNRKSSSAEVYANNLKVLQRLNANQLNGTLRNSWNY